MTALSQPIVKGNGAVAPAPSVLPLAALSADYAAKKAVADLAEAAAKEAAQPLLEAMQTSKVLKFAVDDETSVSVTAASSRMNVDGKAAVQVIEQLTATVQALAARLAALGEDVQLPADLGAVPYNAVNVAASLRVNRKGGVMAKNTLQVNRGSALCGSEISIHHPSGVTVAEAHAEAKKIPGVRTTETIRQVCGTITSFGYEVLS